MDECGYINPACGEQRCIRRPEHAGSHIYAAKGVTLVPAEGGGFHIVHGETVIRHIPERF